MPYMHETSSDDEVPVSLGHDLNTGPKSGKKRPATSRPDTITGLFHVQVSRHPTHIAVQSEDHTPLSYRELDRLSNKLASVLLEHEVSVVAVCLDRSPQLIISILAILKTGRAYVVLDCHGSRERNNIIIKDANVRSVLTDSTHQQNFDSAVDVVALLENLSADSSPSSSPAVQVSPKDLAYIIYTSGSIGRPKGVLISHKAAAIGINHFSLNDCKRWLLFYNPIFSAAQRTILGTLCHGGCVCLTSQDRLMANLSDVLNNMKIEALGITPSMLATLSADSMPSSLRQVVTVGEPLGDLDVSAWIGKLANFKVSYGLSECAQLNLSRTLRIGDRPSIVGSPSDSTTALILRPGTTVELFNDEIGELCLQGPQLADGYLGLLEETSKRFVKGPNGSGRMFRTGDLARKTSSGAIEILGRVDRQMKINGQRLDPEEVATILRRHELVIEATIVDAEIKGEHSLVAVISICEVADWTSLVDELRVLTSSQLPSYMIPRFWLRYETLPRNANGKLDWRKIQQHAELTDPEILLAHKQKKFESSDMITDEDESLIREVWASVLDIEIESIYRHHSFLSLGGSSMAAIRMINELRKKGIEMSLESFFSQDDIATIGSRHKATMSATSSQKSSQFQPFSLIEDEELKQNLREKLMIDAYPATDFQESVLASTISGSLHYTYQRMWKIDHCDIYRLQLAFHVQFLRSSTLRTSFVSTEHGLIQVVKSDMEFPWQTLNEDINGYLQLDLRAGFQLNSPMWRAAVLNESVLIVTMHHALFDFWSHHFLYHDVSALYKGLSGPRRPSFQKFVNHVQKADQGEAKDFWAQHLTGGSSTILSLSSTSNNTSHSRIVHTSLDKIAASAGITSGSLIQFAWALCLAKHTRSDDVIFAITLSGRDLPVDDIDTLDGPTVTVVPQRIKLSAHDTVRGVLEAVHKTSWQLLKHSQFGLRKALKAGSCDLDIFDTMINILPSRPQQQHTYADVFQEFGEKPQWKTEHTVLQAQLESDHAKFNITSRMESERSNFILDSFVHILNQVKFKLEQPLSSMEVMTSQEIDHLNKPAQFPEHLPENMLTGFYESVAARPDSIALQWQNIRSINYTTLNEKSNQMANLLRHYKVEKGDRVCLYLEKSPLMIIVILGCLKAGAVYVPLSPENPLDRNAFIAADTEAVLTLSEPGIEGAAGISNNVLLLEEADLDVFSWRQPRTKLTKEDPSYIIYTSGSTGTPKGCLLTHGAAAAAIQSMIKFERRHEREDFRALQFSNYVFDASIVDIFNTLNSAGTLCMAPTDRLLSDLPGVIREMQIHHSFFTPTVLRLLDPVTVPSLKSLTIGGESLNAEVLETWTGPGYNVMQGYGPTETAMVCIMKSMSQHSSPTNLGVPLDTTACFILDREMDELAPYGSVGELCIAGPQVGAGYWKRPETTEKVFKVLETSNGSLRYYRSGDLARWLPGGEIEYIGRKDHQVKIHGYRIELGEIERTLMSARSVNDCVTMVTSVDTKTQLVSFVVFETGEEGGIQSPDGFIGDVKTLFSHTESLAHYMIPKYLLPLYSFPRTAGGKADRKKLETWLKALDGKELAKYCFETFGDTASVDDEALEPVQNEQERLLATGFSQVLKLPSEAQISRASNFLSLGGDSISAINLTSYVRKHGYELTVSTILKSPVLRILSGYLQGSSNVQNGSESLTSQTWTIPKSFDIESLLKKSGRTWNDIEYTYPCPPGQTEFLEHGCKDSKGWILMTVRPMQHDIDRWLTAVKKLTELNDILRTTYVRYASYPVPQWMGLVLKNHCTSPRLEIMRNITAETRNAAIDSIWNTTFAFGEPFIRYAVLVHTDGKQELVTKMDHALYDGTLLRVWADQFSAIQNDLPLPEVTPFSSFVTHIHQSDKSRALSYWKRTIRPHPFDFPPSAPHHQLNACARVDCAVTLPSLNLGPTSTLESVASKAAVTIPILFQAAFQLWLSSYSPSPSDITFDYLYTGRNIGLPNPQSINGTCATFFPLRSLINPGSSITSYVTDTQEHFWAATENATVGLHEMYDAAGLDCNTCRNKVLFLFQPFNAPVVSSSEPPHHHQQPPMKYVYMVGAQTRMPQPYAIVCEIKKVADGSFKVQFTFDPEVLTTEEAKRGVQDVVAMFERVVRGIARESQKVSVSVADVLQ